MSVAVHWQKNKVGYKSTARFPRSPAIPNQYEIVHKKTMCRRTIQGTIGSRLAKGQGWLQIHRTILYDSQPSPTMTYEIVHQKTMCRRTIQGTIQGTIGSQLAKGQGRLQIHRTIPTIPNNPQPLHSYHQMANNNPHCTHANDL